MTALRMLVALAAATAAAGAGTSAAAPGDPPPQPGTPAWAETADVTEHLGDRLPLDLMFVDSSGQRTQLRSLFDGKRPVLLVLAYYECPQLCSLVLDSTVAAIRTLGLGGWQVGREYRVATISFNATERIDQAARKQASVIAGLGGLGGGAGLGGGGPDTWPFLVGDEPSVRSLTDALGFRFLRDPHTGAIAHPAVVFALTPDGAIARYLYGVDYPARDMKLALLEASQGKTGTIGDRILMRCFQYDPASRRYGLFVTRFMKLGGFVIFLVVLAMLSGFARYEWRRARGGDAP
jgi:protein SCO1/2